MIRRDAMIGACCLLLASLTAARAQPVRRPRVGVLVGGTLMAYGARIGALRAGLAERGYSAPGTLELAVRPGENQPDRLAAHARELAAAPMDVIVAGGTTVVRALVAVTRTIPIVVASATDLLGTGLVASLARPGANVTGLTAQRLDLAPKQLELLGDLLPGLQRLAVVRGSAVGGGPTVSEAFRQAADARGIAVQIHVVASLGDIDDAFAAMVAAGSQAGILVDTPVLLENKDHVGRFGRRVPLLATSREFVDAGVVLSYGPNVAALYRRAAYFVDRILKGAAPADLPVEQPSTFELVINLGTAKALGLSIPPSLLARADEVIE
jgi:putative tryptophan/tyrosine transport system substrate-binding protein